ncbi:MAG TPA: hypothetical protein VFK47_18755 [Ktedonobacteraceae bacterium]|nr:hypothetical protein [Ktedonobacteraceae bacterium]
MSKLLNFTATGNIGPASGFRMGGITLQAGTAAATAQLTEVVGASTFTRMTMTAAANTTVPHGMTDWENGAFFDGQLVLSTLTGNGASVNIEEL